MSNALEGTNHVSAIGQRVGTNGLFWGFAAPIMLAVFYAMVVAVFAPASMRVGMIIWAAPVGLLAMLAAPLWYLRGWARWAVFGMIVAVLALGMSLYWGSLKLAAMLA